jgi:hypothetical protein
VDKATPNRIQRASVAISMVGWTRFGVRLWYAEKRFCQFCAGQAFACSPHSQGVEWRFDHCPKFPEGG